jgi:hypothetical protein
MAMHAAQVAHRIQPRVILNPPRPPSEDDLTPEPSDVEDDVPDSEPVVSTILIDESCTG